MSGFLVHAASGAFDAALIDRLLHHCHIVNIRGNSYRMREHRNLVRPEFEQTGPGVAP